MQCRKPFGKAGAPEALRLSLCDLRPDVADSWVDFFRDVEEVEILRGSLLDLECAALVSPANGFGDMSGGIDKAIDDFFGGMAQRSVVAAIRREFLGELPVGAALVVPVEGPRFPYVVAAPTMRTPAIVADSLNAYLAMRGALVAVLRHNASAAPPIRTLAVPGLCTGVGGMSPGRSAQQMRAAYDNVIREGWKEVVHPAQAPFALGAGGRKWTLY